MKLYHNPRCSKSRQALALLEDKNVEVIEYLQNPLSVDELRELCTKLGIKPAELLRTKEEEYKELASNGPPDDETALSWMAKHPKLMERPIFVNGSKAIIGRPPERVLEIL